MFRIPDMIDEFRVFCFFFSKIIVDGVRGTIYLGDAALDDFSFQNGTCNQTGIYRTVKK